MLSHPQACIKSNNGVYFGHDTCLWLVCQAMCLMHLGHLYLIIDKCLWSLPNVRANSEVIFWYSEYCTSLLQNISYS